ncbi:MAG: FAD-dependent oxidoreductase [Oscillospiraceae bacterium]|nr:FAD-dependent oxidoreductase [Oscillospiraceae bacterium]MBQ5342061.1 FAD-dependent oxidoreductase [Oscillospiraceae bacterium]MBR4827522.1 FAD-dependent oxidoreductase [Oscillospiraceae bacterium]MBR5065510.1 FAD-dependent oxidoreductase [Oscillospiraceae bacterium]
MAETVYDILIVGAGPAGLTAAIYACRAGKSVLVLEKEVFGGQITHSPKVENYPGYLEMSGNEFAELLMMQAQDQGAEIDLAEVLDVTVDDSGIKHVMTDMGEYLSRALIIASGSKHRELGVPGEQDYVGKGISYCAVCDGAFYAGKHVAVIGGGNSALQEAVMLAERCSQVTVVQNLAFLTGEEKLSEKLFSMDNVDFIYSSVVEALEGEDELERVILHNTETGQSVPLEVDGVFVAIGQVPENGPFAKVAKLAMNGYFDSGENCTTMTPGVFVAGDCRQKNVRQITTATGDAAVAAVSACRWLDSQ